MRKSSLDVSFIEERSEEVQHIIDRMPTKFGLYISVVVGLIFVLLVTFGWIVRYPDVVYGQIVLNTASSPIKLVANASGRLKLRAIKSMDEVSEGQTIAYIETTTTPEKVALIDSLIKFYNPNSEMITQLYHKLPKNLSLGDLNVKYYSFSSALEQFVNYKNHHFFEKQINNLNEILSEQQQSLSISEIRMSMVKTTAAYAHKFYTRDSILFSKRVISESEFDNTEIAYINAKDAYQNARVNITNIKLEIQQTENKIQELGITKPEKEKELRMLLISSYNDLTDNIKSWKQKYLFVAPFKGKVQYLKFYSNNQFIQPSEALFSIIPIEKSLIGQVIIPAKGSGKVVKGQEVIVKLDNFPYNEFGSITGIVKSISLITSTTKIESNETETYQVLVDFPRKMETNYGIVLSTKAESRGSAEIVTNDRRLIQRLFGNLKYSIIK